ncbi:MAG: acetoacetate decarboxylase family protein, partial [archaeon]|nr:acetoacetate decarboxylase family protein [archaeon]
PPPLKPPKIPLAHGFIGNYPKTNFGLPYSESALFVRAVFDGNEGNYCLAMHLDGPGKGLAMAGGREHFGFPKKLAEISFNYDEGTKTFEGTTARHGVNNMELKVNFVGKMNEPEAPKILIDVGIIPSKIKNPDTYNYNYKFFPSVDGVGFDYKPKLTAQTTKFSPNMLLVGQADLKLGSTSHDPWAEIEVVKTLGALFQKGNNSMARGKVVAEIDPEEFLPYSTLKWDWD